MIRSSTRLLVPVLSLLALGLGLGGCAAENLKKENAELREQQAQLSTQLEEVQGRIDVSESAARQAQAEKQSLMEQNQRLQQQLVSQPVAPAFTPAPAPAPSGDSGRVARGGSSQDDDVVITVAGDVLFGPGSATLSSAGKRELDSVARTIRSRYASKRIRVEGYTDSDPIKRSRWGSNKELSQARAEAVETYLVSKGISSGRITAMGMGSAKPKSTKAQSRRVEIVILGG
jgi:chemotaxis protein MotB